MDNQLMTYGLDIAKDLIGIAVIVITPYIIKTLKAIEAKAQKSVGESNYSYAKNFITEEYSLHKDLFTEDNLVNVIDSLENKFINKLSRDTIKHIVDVVIVDVAKEVVK